eukprot:COSAG03_NODE_10157_length_668_cov_1.493849_1_plen_92_part_00
MVDYPGKLRTFPELRDREGWRAIGLPLTARSDVAARLLDLAFRAAFTRSAPRYHALDAAKVAAAAVQADGTCTMVRLTSTCSLATHLSIQV